ncbi:hypothetical protein OJF2_12160 [Aquisphaera giovannonii]|uniref:Glycosyl hydrolases family 43 n=1 Tax=Aquisphaera giovannonii TaxID=406548 RepID=A0A5B9VXP3_9BACT|nr:hypothetical protein [Aquisphaera giovannonii]QEH32737.1 hypothetical protein OJF2_12160 [Aquisphaera giovannonii]
MIVRELESPPTASNRPWCPRIASLIAAWLSLVAANAFADEPAQIAAGARPFRIEVVDDETGRGVPLIELKTTNQLRYVTDSNGIVAFDEPGLLGRKVHFEVEGHGYEYPKDGFGIRGVALDTRPGGSATIKVHRINIARRLYRLTGAGIYRDSVLTGAPVPISDPLLDAQVMGQDSVLEAVYGGKIHWFWGDTARPSYPLGNFHMPGAVSDLPGQGGLDPSKGVNLSYFTGPDGFARPTCEMPGPGPTWATGLTVLKDGSGKERMLAYYVKIRPPMEAYQRGFVEWNPASNRFEKVAEFSGELAAFAGEHPGGHTFLRKDDGKEYVYFCSPYPIVRSPATVEALGDPEAWEAYTCLAPGSRASEKALDRGPDGSLRYGWKRRTPVLNHVEQDKLVSAGKLKAEEGLFQLRDVETGKRVLAHGGTVYWNDYRKRWILIAVETFGRSMLGEVWFAEADSPPGPFVYARRIVTHEKYSFYNPKQHPVFDQEGGRIVYFEGTYTASFSGNDRMTPRYEYNQVMYQLDLADGRLALPVAIGEGGSPVRLAPRAGIDEDPARALRGVAFFAPDRPGVATVPIREGKDERGGQTLTAGPGDGGPPLFYAISAEAEKPPAGTRPLYEFRERAGAGRYYSIEETPRAGYRREPRPLGRVWENPGRPRPNR